MQRLRRGAVVIAGEPLPEGHSARKLSAALEAAGAPRGMIRRAERGYYHDFLSPLALPELALTAELLSAAGADPEHGAALLLVRQRVIAGDFDATKAESDEWMASPEGQAALRELNGGDGP